MQQEEGMRDAAEKKAKTGQRDQQHRQQGIAALSEGRIAQSGLNKNGERAGARMQCAVSAC
jgi:hypothetical protein